VQYGYGDGSNIRAANAYVINSGQYWQHVSLDQVAPCNIIASCPGLATFPATYLAWAPSHAYTKGNIVLFTCSSRQWYFQAQTTGSSAAGSQPACKNYGGTITDGGTTWLLVAPSVFSAMQADTGVGELMVTDVDMTGFFNDCFAATNTFGGTAPNGIYFKNVTPGGCVSAGIHLKAGSGFHMQSGDIQGCLGTGCANVFVETSFSGVSGFTGVRIWNGGAYSVLVGANVVDMTFIGNFFNTGSTAAIALAGSNNFITGIGNNCRGAATGLTGAPGAGGYFPSGAAGNPGC
jgi:hypothetical protein